MQGWRKSNEDAHSHILDLGDGNALFAIYDGHDTVSKQGSCTIWQLAILTIWETIIKTLKNSCAYVRKAKLKTVFKIKLITRGF